MKKENIALIIFLVFVIGAGVYFYTSQTVPQNVADVNPAVVHREPPRVVARPPKTTTLELSGKIDEHLTINNELRDVNFCGKTYKVRQVLIDGVDVVQRVAELATKNLIPSTFEKGPLITEEEKRGGKIIMKEGAMAKQICENVRLNTHAGEVIKTTVKKKFNGIDIGMHNEEIYPVLAEEVFYVAIPSNNIYGDDGFSGTLIGPIGKLK